MLLLQSLDVGEGRSGNLLTLGSRKELDCVVAHINEQFRQKVNPKSKVLDLKIKLFYLKGCSLQSRIETE